MNATIAETEQHNAEKATFQTNSLRARAFSPRHARAHCATGAKLLIPLCKEAVPWLAGP